jgi:amino acid permease
VLALFYAGYLLITSSGKEESMKKAKSIIVNIFIIALVIFLFLLIVYQVFNEFS